MGTQAIEASQAVPFTPSTLSPRTQKARGIAALARSTARILVPRFEVFPADKVQPEQLVGYFSRPCPMRPRHGFVDSRTIDNVGDGMELIRQTLDADPEAEIVTMPLIDAEFSGIWTPGLLTIGPGHDGATAGQSSCSVPALGSLVKQQTIQDADVTGSPYVELLWPRKESVYRLVQLRDGPCLPQTVNFIPRRMKVERIVVAEGDLLDWEREMQTVSSGTVVYHPSGSLASHYAIHAVLNQIPVLVDREPLVGGILEPERDVVTASSNLAALRAGFQLALRLQVTYEDAAHAMLAGCHHVSVWVGKHDDLLGVALGFAYRLTVTAALGEMRHVPVEGEAPRKVPRRDMVYEDWWNEIRRSSANDAFEKALYAFHEVVWARGYGGAKWFFIAKWAALMRNYLVEGYPELALQMMNQLVHCVHNTGWAFNKFVPEATMTQSARDPISALVLCVPVLMRALHLLKKHGGLLAQQFVRRTNLLQIPEGEPNYEDFEIDEERRSNWNEEEESDERLEGRQVGRGRSRVRRHSLRSVRITDDGVPF